MDSLVDGLSRFTIATIGREGSAEVQTNLLSETCQNVDLQNQSTQTDEGEIFNISEVQNPYKLPLNPESIVFIKKPDESASYRYSFEDNR